jgi:hypothetical protein
MEDLIDLAIEFSQTHLKPSGALLVKCFKDMGFTQNLEKFRARIQSGQADQAQGQPRQVFRNFPAGRGLKNPASKNAEIHGSALDFFGDFATAHRPMDGALRDAGRTASCGLVHVVLIRARRK